VRVNHIAGEPAFGSWTATSVSSASHHQRSYTVQIRSLQERANYCTCPDWASNQLGTCKHIEAVLHRLRKMGETGRSHEQSVPLPFIYLSWSGTDGPAIRLQRSASMDEQLSQLLGRYFDASGQFRGDLPDDFFRFHDQVRGRDDLLVGEDAILHVRGLAEDAAHRIRGEHIRQEILRSGNSLPGVRARLYPYQVEGAAFLAARGRALLADDMGLGKTLQTLGHIQQERDSGRLTKPTLIVAPTSLLGNWKREAERFTPNLSTHIWHGTQRKLGDLTAQRIDIVITSYALVTRDIALLAAHKFGCVVLDEAQAIKNPTAKVTQALKTLDVDRRICLTGTPLENHLGELWSQFDFLMPGFLGTRKHFNRYFRTPIENHGSTDRQQRLSALIRPFLLRRRKEQVATELPPKTEIVREVALEPEQARLYESIRVSMEQRVRALLAERGLARSHIEMLDALLKLRQTCCHPALVKLDSARGIRESAKTDLLMSMLDELISEGKKILLFSQFTEMLGLIELELNKREIRYAKLTGRTRKRDDVIDSFQHGDIPLFLISLKAGGTGLNLTSADTVIHYDPWWNPAVENQASDRAHRIGQNKPVFIYKLVASNTVEEKIMAMQAQKQLLADQTINQSEGAAMQSLTADDIMDLFAASDPTDAEQRVVY
ncbi:MAG: DEAD/DEAH box helicase, partial [Granulosicoccus sp.]